MIFFNVNIVENNLGKMLYKYYYQIMKHIFYYIYLFKLLY